MPTVASEAIVQATPQRTWTYLTRFADMPRWFFGVRHVTVSADTPCVGTERTVSLWCGLSYRERITRWEPEKHFTILVIEPTLLLHSPAVLVQMSPVADWVRVRWTVSYSVGFGWLGEVFERVVVRPALRFALRVSLRRLCSCVSSQEQKLT